MKLHAIIPQHQKQRFPGVGVLLHRLDPRPDRVDGSLFFFSTRWHCTSRALPTYKPRLEIASSTQWANNKVGFLFCFFVFFYNPWSTEKGSVEKERIGKESEKKKGKRVTGTLHRRGFQCWEGVEKRPGLGRGGI